MQMPTPTLHWTDLEPLEVIFSWDDPESGASYQFAVERLGKYLKANPVEIVNLAIDPVFAASISELRGLERHRLMRLMEMKTPDNFSPIICCAMPDNTGLVVDGNHRYWLAWVAGRESIKAYIVPEDVWSRFLFEFPQYGGNSQIGFSGII